MSAVPFLVLIVALSLYLLPTIIAWCRKHRNVAAIFALNFFTGWSILGWVGSLIWAVAR